MCNCTSENLEIPRGAIAPLSRKSIFAGVVAGEIVMLAGKWWLG
jgi:hypothetical protein